MPEPREVIALVGSLRRESFSRRVMHSLADLAPTTLRVNEVPTADLAHYNADHEDAVPASWQQFRERVGAADAVLLVTPEYNRSVPGTLKNAIDIASRPSGMNRFAGKPAAIVSVTPFKLGAFGANHHLRQCLVFLDMPTLQQPEAYLSLIDRAYDSNTFTDAALRDFLRKFMAGFAEWIDRIRPP